MASHHGRGNSISPEPYHFFKIILQSTIRDGKLGLPPKFARDYGNTLSSPVFFEVPNGQVWELELKKLDGKIWVQNGLAKFSEHYSLELRHFLVFRYQGNCRFHVLIFDQSASEIHYPNNNDKEKDEVHQQEGKTEESEEDGSVPIINNIRIPKAMRKKPVLQCPRPRKMMRARRHTRSKALETASSAFNSETPFFLALMQSTYVGRLNSKLCYLNIPREFSTKYLMNHGDVILRDSNGKTWPAEYISLLAMDKRPYVRLGNGWGAFVRDNNLQVGDICVFELINHNDNTFRVFIYGSKKADFQGLRAFTDVFLGPLKVHETTLQRIMKAREKALQKALANDREKLHQVVNIEESEDDSVQIINNITNVSRKKPVCPQKMMRAGRHNNEFSSVKGKKKRLKPYEKLKVIERACSAFKSENPFFLVLMQPSSVGCLNSNVKCYLSIPVGFSRKYLKRRGDVVLSDSKGKTWSVEYYTFLGTNRRPYVQLYKGWNAFVRDNNLRVGDACAFELINRNDITFRVSIYGGKKACETDTQRAMKACETDTHRAMKACETDTQRAMKAREKALERALAFTSENPYFLVVLRPSYVQSHQVFISNQFASKHFQSTLTKVDVSLCLSNGKSWPAEYHQQRTEKLNARICNGWRAFVIDNKLKVGDVCVFEMMKDTRVTFKVSIFLAIADEDVAPSQGISEPPLVSTSQSAKAPFIFRRVVLPSHLKQKCVDIPFILAEQYFKPNIEKLILQVADRSWPVEIKIYSRSRRAKLATGWIEFARENSLSEGDLCVYELDTVDNSLLKVSISKSAS